MISKWEDLPPEMSTSDAKFYNELAWYSHLDNRYCVEVKRIKPYEGILSIYDHELDDKEIYRELVGIAWDAKFGPDFEDVQEWSNMAMKFVDEEYTIAL